MVNNIAKDQLVKEELQPEIEVDMEIGFEEITSYIYKDNFILRTIRSGKSTAGVHYKEHKNS